MRSTIANIDVAQFVLSLPPLDSAALSLAPSLLLKTLAWASLAGLRRLELTEANPSRLVGPGFTSLEEIILWKFNVPRHPPGQPASSGLLPPEPEAPFPRLVALQIPLDADIWEPRDPPADPYPGVPRAVHNAVEQKCALRFLRWLGTPPEMPRLRKVAVVLSFRLLDGHRRHKHVDRVKRVLVDAGSRRSTRLVEVLVPDWSEFADGLCHEAATENPHASYDIVGPRHREEVPPQGPAEVGGGGEGGEGGAAGNGGDGGDGDGWVLVDPAALGAEAA
ncbi:hypothetical protein DFJ74DRAFT_399969 [Hyaloraphidium curvatum]|nr:hypothetical protein DFJ74DRAFT_399969 [Hyaloraphidium curvatum]